MFGFLRIGERLTALERTVRKLEAAERTLGAIEARLARLTDVATQQPTAKDLRELRLAVRALTARDDRQALEGIGRLAASGRPIVVGPWTGELGFELLYWIPFVAWVCRQWDVPGDRLLVVSRGGVGSWYGVGEQQYADVFSFISPDRFRTAVAEAKRTQRRESPLDEEIVDAVRRGRGLPDGEWLHPGVMYRLFAPFWSDEAGYARIDQFTRHRLIAADAARSGDGAFPAPPLRLPADYIAVRFYFSECFPDTLENRSFAQQIVRSLAERHQVVLLNPGFSIDEHEDWTGTLGGNVHAIAERLPAERNLGIQAEVIRGARAFVGTYGGYAYLAPMCRVPALAFYSRPAFKHHHLYAAERAFEQMGAAALTVVDAAAAPLAQSALGAIADLSWAGLKPRATGALS